MIWALAGFVWVVCFVAILMGGDYSSYKEKSGIEIFFILLLVFLVTPVAVPATLLHRLMRGHR